jgi:ATP-binding cassette subfamily F protein 3
VRAYAGDLDSYRAECLTERAAPEGRPLDRGAAKRTPHAARRQAAERRAALAPLKARIVAAEREVERIAARIAAIDVALGERELYARDPARVRTLARERSELVRARQTAEAAWLAASEAHETAATEAKAGVA